MPNSKIPLQLMFCTTNVFNLQIPFFKRSKRYCLMVNQQPLSVRNTQRHKIGDFEMPVLQRWKVSRPQLINSMLSDEAVLPTTCQWCRQGVAVMRCSECLPHQYLCMACDKEQHTRHVLHNRRSLIPEPVPPTSFVSQDADGQYSLTHQGKVFGHETSSKCLMESNINTVKCWIWLEALMQWLLGH